MGQTQSKGEKTAGPSGSKTSEKQSVGPTNVNPNEFLGEVPETTNNVCGLLEDGYLITSPMDDPIERDFAFYHIYNFTKAEACTYAIIARPEVKRYRSLHTMNSFYDVMKIVQKKSNHFPILEKAGSMQKLIFGMENEQQEERDPEWKARPVMIISTRRPIVFLAAFFSYSPTGFLPVQVALHAALGMCRALAALHRAGFVSRFVTPYSFAIESPFTIDNIAKNMMMVDLCLAKEWPSKPNANVQFTGTPKYSSLKVHQKIEQQGPSDDLISVIYIVAEMISGKLPWRSVKDLGTIRKMKANFHKTPEFQRLPHEVRTIYGEMLEVGGLQTVDHLTIVTALKKAIDRKSLDFPAELPKWLCLPFDD